VAEGKLEVTKAKKLIVNYTNARGRPVTGQIPDGQLSADLVKLRDDKKTIDQLNGVDVEFELEGAVLKQIRRKGQPFMAAVPPPAPPAPQRGTPRPGQQARFQQQQGRQGQRPQDQP
jgi:hypothetical protein